MTPLFIVDDLGHAVDHYRDVLGFEVRLLLPATEPFFALVGRDGASLMLKQVGDGVGPAPNPLRHRDARWDAFVHATDPDALAEELSGRGAAFHEPLENHDDGLRGFAVADPDGYVLFFGHPTAAPDIPR